MYVKSYGVLSFARIFEDKYGTKRIDTPTKTVTGILKSAWKRVMQKTIESTGDLINYKIGDKIAEIASNKSNKSKIMKYPQNYNYYQNSINKLLMIIYHLV